MGGGDQGIYERLQNRVTVTRSLSAALGTQIARKLGTADQRRIAAVLKTFAAGSKESTSTGVLME